MAVTSTEYIDQFIHVFRDALISQGKTLEGVDIEALVRSTTRTIPGGEMRNALVDDVGPYYDTNGVARWLGVSRQALQKRVRQYKMLACKTGDNVLLYPVWQFTDHATVLPGLSEVLPILAQGIDSPWTWAQWLTSEGTENFDGMSAITWLESGRDREVVKALAREDATSWAA